jgi:transcriptional regulator with XRE-family HTH domain
MPSGVRERATRQEPMADYLAFSRRLKELIARERLTDVAGRLGYTSARVSQLARGEKPSREFVYRLCEQYKRSTSST